VAVANRTISAVHWSASIKLSPFLYTSHTKHFRDVFTIRRYVNRYFVLPYFTFGHTPLLVKKSPLGHIPVSLNALTRGDPLQMMLIRWPPFQITYRQNPETISYPTWKTIHLFSYTFIHFYTIPVRDIWTYKNVAAKTALSIHAHYKKYKVTVKVKCYKKLITSRWHHNIHFYPVTSNLVSSFSVIVQTHRHIHTNRHDQNNTLLCWCTGK